MIALLGGIGLFLFGMQSMTEALRQIASSRARSVLAAFARNPLSGALTGAATTAAVQSSTATMVTTVGFVGAGMLTFPQALGIIFGANIGTTVTGWMVMFLGFRLPLSAAAMPLLFAAALLRVLVSGQTGRVATAVAGLCLIFLGIELMKDGMAAFRDDLSPATFPAPTIAGRLQLVGLGLAITLVTQSSSAGVAATLVLVAGGAVGFEQAAALVIGMHIGTTFTPVLAAIGGSIAVRRTAIANVVYLVISGALALGLIDLFGAALNPEVSRAQAQLALVAFHTGFNVVGAVVMLPLVRPYAALIGWLVPDAPRRLSAPLDRRALSDPAAALDALSITARGVVRRLFEALGGAMKPGASPRHLPPVLAECTAALTEMHAFQAQIQLPGDDFADLERHEALLHLQDHLTRIIYRAGQSNRMTGALADPKLRRAARHLGVLLSCQSAGIQVQPRLERLNHHLNAREARLRRQILRSGLAPARLFALTDSLRWLRRTSAHAERIVHYNRLAGPQWGRPKPPPAAAEDVPPQPEPQPQPAQTGASAP